LNNSHIETQSETMKSEYTSVDGLMREFGVKQNVYTTSTLDSLERTKSQLAVALKACSDAYAKELARQRANDALCKDFANVAEPFVQWTVDEKDKITNSTVDLEDQLKYVVSRISSQSKDGAKLADVKNIDAKMEAVGITNNRYTKLTAKDVEVIWGQYTIFLDKKKKMLDGEIERNKLRGITQEQFNEIEGTFKQFDDDGSKSIDKRELKACLYSLGEEKSKSEVEAILKEFGDGTGIKFPGFREFMIKILGVSDTKEDIVNSFILLNKGEAIAVIDKMELVMEEEDVQYIKQTAPKSGAGYNYTEWTNDVFSR